MGEGLKRAFRATALTRLSSNHINILRVIAKFERREAVGPTAPEISLILGRRYSGWAAPKLRWLEEFGFVERAGVAGSNARTWRLTDEGRDLCDVDAKTEAA